MGGGQLVVGTMVMEHDGTTMMTNPGLFVVDGSKWNNGKSEMGLTCGSEPDGTFHAVVGPS